MEREVWNIAYSARKRAEEIALQEGFGDDLCGMCYRAASILFKMLKKAGYSPKIAVAYHWPHGFVILNDHIIDVTATQFLRSRNEKVVIRPLTECEFLPYYHPTNIYFSVEDMVGTEGWDSDPQQMPQERDYGEIVAN